MNMITGTAIQEKEKIKVKGEGLCNAVQVEGEGEGIRLSAARKNGIFIYHRIK